MKPITRHATTLFLGLISIVIAILDFSTPTSQLFVSTLLFIIGTTSAGIVFRTNYARNHFLAGIEMFLFLVSALISVGVVIDIGVNWSEFQARVAWQKLERAEG